MIDNKQLQAKIQKLIDDMETAVIAARQFLPKYNGGDPESNILFSQLCHISSAAHEAIRETQEEN